MSQASAPAPSPSADARPKHGSDSGSKHIQKAGENENEEELGADTDGPESEAETEDQLSDVDSDVSDEGEAPVPKDMPRSFRDAWAALKQHMKRLVRRYSKARWLQYYSKLSANGGRATAPDLSDFGLHVVLVALPTHEGAAPRCIVAGCERFTPEGLALVHQRAKDLGLGMMISRELVQVRLRSALKLMLGCSRTRPQLIAAGSWWMVTGHGQRA